MRGPLAVNSPLSSGPPRFLYRHNIAAALRHPQNHVRYGPVAGIPVYGGFFAGGACRPHRYSS